MTELRTKQAKFVRFLARLFDFAYANGYTLGLGEAKRSDEQAEINAMGETGRARLMEVLNTNSFTTLANKLSNNGKANGIRGSLHEMGLAIDLNLYQGDAYLDKSEHHKPLGEFWEALDPDCRWGGRFSDGNHYSIAHGGKQ